MSFVSMMEGHLAWGDKPLLDNADLTVEAGQRIGLIGRTVPARALYLKFLRVLKNSTAGSCIHRTACMLSM